MAALDRYDDWERQVDASLDQIGADVRVRGEAEDADPDVADLADPADGRGFGLNLAEVYDPVTLAAIEAQAQPAAARSSGWRGGVTAGAMVVGMVNGVRDVLDTDDDEPVVEIDEAEPASRLEPVTVHLAWGAPAASVAIVRPWLLSLPS